MPQTNEQKIGYVVTHHPRVALTFISGEAEAIGRRGFDVHMFAMNDPEDSDLASAEARTESERTFYLKRHWGRAVGAFFGNFFRHPFSMTALFLKALASAGFNPGLIVRRKAHLIQASLLASEARKRNIRHLHAHFGLAPATIAWLASEILRMDDDRAGFSFTIHGFHDFVEPSIARLDLKAKAAKFVVGISQFTKSQLCRETEHVLWNKYEVVRCGIDLDRLAFAPKEPNEGPVTILSVARLSAEKGFGILLDAMAKMGGDARLRVVGDGPMRNELESMAADLGIGDRVTFAGELPPDIVAEELRNADIFCLPSFSEGLPVSIMEAMAVGTPVVATWISGIPELAVDGETALTVAPADSDMLADALTRMAGDTELRTRLAGAARKKVEAMHDRDLLADQLAGLYRSALS